MIIVILSLGTTASERENVMIGLSVMDCFPDMATGKVDPHYVSKIIGSTAAATSEEWERLIRDLRAQLWSHLSVEVSEKAEALLRQFLAEGRIEQPRLDPKNPRTPDLYGVGRDGVWWHGREDKIRFKPYLSQEALKAVPIYLPRRE